MALVDRVQERFSTSRLVSITNPDDASFSTIDTTFLGILCDDVEAYLDGLGVGSYDESNAKFIALACDGVIALGQKRIKPGESNEIRWNEWTETAEQFARTLRKNAPTPQIAAPERPSRFDASTWNRITPGRPHRRRP